MIVKLKDKDYRVSWRYKRDCYRRDVTYCTICDPKTGFKEADSIVVRRPNEPFVKELARKYSLAKALRFLKLNAMDRQAIGREDRKVFWDAYFGRKPEKKSPATTNGSDFLSKLHNLFQI